MTAKRQIESSINSGTMLDGTGGHVNSSRILAFVRLDLRRLPRRLLDDIECQHIRIGRTLAALWGLVPWIA